MTSFSKNDKTPILQFQDLNISLSIAKPSSIHNHPFLWVQNKILKVNVKPGIDALRFRKQKT